MLSNILSVPSSFSIDKESDPFPVEGCFPASTYYIKACIHSRKFATDQYGSEEHFLLFWGLSWSQLPYSRFWIKTDWKKVGFFNFFCDTGRIETVLLFSNVIDAIIQFLLYESCKKEEFTFKKSEVELAERLGLHCRYKKISTCVSSLKEILMLGFLLCGVSFG